MVSPWRWRIIPNSRQLLVLACLLFLFWCMTLYRVSNFSLGKQKESEVLKVCINFRFKISFYEGAYNHQKLGLYNLFYQQSERKWSFWSVYGTSVSTNRKYSSWSFINLNINRKKVRFLRFVSTSISTNREKEKLWSEVLCQAQSHKKCKESEFLKIFFNTSLNRLKSEVLNFGL